jgi:hypothetical protein
MSKPIKNDLTKDPEDQRDNFPRGTPASAGLHPEVTEDPTDQPDSKGAWHPTKAGAAAEQQGRTTQEGAAEQSVANTGHR